MVTTVTTTTTVSMSTAAASLTLIVILTLITLLIQKEFISGLDGPRAKQIGQALNIAIMPLLLVFIASVASKVVDSLH